MKIYENLPPELLLLAQICTNSYVGCLQRSQDPLAGSGVGTPGKGKEGGMAVAKGWGWDGRGKESKEGGGKGVKGIRSLCNLTLIFRYNCVKCTYKFSSQTLKLLIFCSFFVYFVLYFNSSSDYHYSDILILAVLKIKCLFI